MEGLKQRILGVRTFLSEVAQEAKKSVWPEKHELIESTFVVIISVIIMTLFVGVGDKLLVTLLTLLIPPSA
jgi:preprotein translocase subunit SecE